MRPKHVAAIRFAIIKVVLRWTLYMILRFLQAHRGCHTLRLVRILTSLTHWQVSEVGAKLKQGSSGTTRACSWWRFVFWTNTGLLIHPKVSNVTATEMKWASQLTQRRTPWELRQWRLLRKTVTWLKASHTETVNYQTQQSNLVTDYNYRTSTINKN